MDKSPTAYSIKNQEERIIFDDIPLLSIDSSEDDENSVEEFAKYFSIDNDDVVRLDESQIILREVKAALECLIDGTLSQENEQSQITNLPTKHPLQMSDKGKHFKNKKVRFSIPAEGRHPLTCSFVCETIHPKTEARPYMQFLYNLGFDLCLQQNPNDNNYLTEVNKTLLKKRNAVFHRDHVYSCKYCSFQTDTIHVMDHHYRTPHTLSNLVRYGDKYRCTYCSLQTFRLPELRRHMEKKHGYILTHERPVRRYQCNYCPYESDHKNNLVKHNNRCRIEQERTRMANNLLAPSGQFKRNNNRQVASIKRKHIEGNKKPLMTKQILSRTPPHSMEILSHSQIDEPILIESDHDFSSLSPSSSSSDEDFFISSDEEVLSSEDSEDGNYRDFEISASPRKTVRELISKPSTSLVSHSLPTSTSSTTAPTSLSSLSKLLLLNGAPITTFTSSPINLTKSSLVPIQPKPATTNDIYQACSICQCYVYKRDYIKHMNEKHNSLGSQPQQSISNPITILNSTANSISRSISCLTPTLTITKAIPQPPSTIFLLSTSTMGPQSITLEMIKCPWCDTNFEHIDVMTGHLMRYHRMTLAAAKVVVAEQMKIQGKSSNQLSIMFKEEIENIQKNFADKIYWKISQPKIYLHQMDNFLCFVCNKNIDDVDHHFMTLHQIQLTTMNTIKQCCLCGFRCNKKKPSLYEHQLRMHTGICYSSVLKQFIRFEPPPPPLSRTIISKHNNRSILPSSLSHGQTLSTCTEKKFGCRKCDTSTRLFTFEELVEHLRLNHKVDVKLHRRCIICQNTYCKGKEYNQHCLEHLNDENPSVEIKRYRTKR